MMQDRETHLNLTEANFESEVLDSSKPVLVDFWAAWCGPCQAMAPMVEELAADFEGAAKIAKVDVDDQQALAASFGIRAIPTLLFFQNGEIVDQAIGAVPKKVLVEKLSALLPAA